LAAELLDAFDADELEAVLDVAVRLRDPARAMIAGPAYGV